MLRPSSTAARPSHVPLGASQATSAAAKKVALKAKELAGVTALEGASELFLQRIESFCSDLEVMADSGAVIGQILEQWPHMFRILGLVSETLERIAADREGAPYSISPAGERLVRMPTEELQNDDNA